MIDLAERAAQLPAAKRELLQKLLQKKLSAASQPTAIGRRPAEGPAPLSFAQQRLWFLDQLEPGSPLYNIPMAVRLEGDLDVQALERALNEVVRRHEILRTTLAASGGVPRQVIAPSLHVPLSIDDLSGLPAEGLEAEVLRRLEAEAARPFDLARGPLIRARLLRLGERENVVNVTIHHIASDGWSMGVLIF